MGRLSDKLNSRKGLLILATVIFSVCSFLSGLAQSFALLLGARQLREGEHDLGREVALELARRPVSRPVREVQARRVEGAVDRDDALGPGPGLVADGELHGAAY